MLKRVYFIRHGESELNARHLRHGPGGHLTEKGREQAKKVGLRFSHIPIDVILASPYDRAKETAEVISELVGRDIEYSDLLVERRNPSEIVGKESEDPEVRRIVDIIDNSFHTDALRFSDEENFDDLKARAAEVLEFLERRPEHNILVVTHSIFLTMVISYMFSREKLTAGEFVKRSYFNTIDNAGITLAIYNPAEYRNATRGWKLISWDDQPYVQATMPLEGI